MMQCCTLINFSVLLLCFTADLLWNFGLLGIHAFDTNNVTCHPCPKGTLGNNSLPSCRNCTNKGWCEDTQNDCLKCPTGYYQNTTGQTKCFPCPEGHYQKDSGQNSCDPCHPGEHQDNLGQTGCKQCPKGFYSKSFASQRCISCQYGGYCNKPGCKRCLPCPPGSEANKMGAEECTACNTGYFKESMGFDVCQLCKRGWYQLKTGQTTCQECPQGFYCPWQDEGPIKCDSNQICPKGSYSAGSDCSIMYTRSHETEECELSSAVYAVIGVVLAVALLGAAFVIVRRYRRKNEHEQRLLERQYPVYTGW